VNNPNGNFICGVVEGFYGRPWTTEQRKKLFNRMKSMGMNTYLYAPKDDCKHRMYWRELYSVEEADHLTSLIEAATENDVEFVYAISPGLDITFSSSKDVSLLKKKLEQVLSFGCKHFALLFDDIDVEMGDADKEVFQSFAHAQVSVTNEVYQHLNQPHFLFCPTEYCATRAVPTVSTSEYLKTLGSRLLPGIDILWTGPKVVSKKITIKSIEELTKVLQRRPVIWDNIHANDYDRRRMFLGPFDGRSPELIPYLRGVLTNPNCEFEANYIAMHTLAQWSKSHVCGSADVLPSDSPLRAEFKLETEADCSSDEEIPNPHSSYKPALALTSAINEWYEEMLDRRKPVVKKIVPVASPTLPLPNPPTPVVNTCMAITPTTGTTPAVPLNPAETFNFNSIEANDSYLQPAMSSVPLNSLVSDTSSESGDESVGEPMDCMVTPGSSPIVGSEIEANTSCNTCSMQIDLPSTSCVTCGILQNQNSPESFTELLSYEDLKTIVDMFYLPFEHGSFATKLLMDVVWLRNNAYFMCDTKKSPNEKNMELSKEWMERAEKCKAHITAFFNTMDRFCAIPNKAIVYDLFPYLWDMKSVLSLLKGFINWLAMGNVPYISVCYMQSYPYTWANKQYVDAFMSGVQEPWVFQGGVQAEIQRLMPLDGAADLLLPMWPSTPITHMCEVRPYTEEDQEKIYEVCQKVYEEQSSISQGSEHPQLVADRQVGGFLTLSPEYCFVIEFQGEVCGYVTAALDAKEFNKSAQGNWIPVMQQKYSRPGTADSLTPEQEIMESFYCDEPILPEKLTPFPSVLQMRLLQTALQDVGITKRALAVLIAALKANGSHGIHVEIPTNDSHAMEFHTKLGFFGLALDESDMTKVLVRSI